ncbi:AI-2E family transporter [Gracilimonas mengyeensis]|uniref:Predicted PurR-regulated permease PerM n=1 Tax=Gracilimonas mengyeensis TaxID=1302730 RepID=A0A521DHG0_9BACT|nr:AI-2E family transporter [Gracilimonas mengyeensis]SMO71214.1 Predicted PurR-regulated permease PerM [Gracilimonas mengyeensis]
MNHHPLKDSGSYPFWFKSTMILAGLCLLFVVMSYGKFILMPLAFSAFFAMLLNPVVRLFERWNLGRAFSIILTILAVLIVVAGILSLISAQFIQFSERVPEVTEKLKSLSGNAIEFLEENAGVSQEKQTEYLEQGINNLIDRSGNYVSSILSATTNVFTTATLLPIFLFFMLYYREMYQTFFHKLITSRHGNAGIDDMLNRVQNVTQNYLVGMLSVIGILAVLNTIGLLIIGLEHALFFGAFASLLAIIPYIGIIIGALPPVLYALLLTDSLLTPVLVVAVFATVQFLEGNFITPRIVGSKVSINPFVAMIALIVGGELWGISGMILFVPLIGILKVMFDQIPALKPYGYLLGNNVQYQD